LNKESLISKIITYLKEGIAFILATSFFALLFICSLIIIGTLVYCGFWIAVFVFISFLMIVAGVIVYHLIEKIFKK